MEPKLNIESKITLNNNTSIPMLGLGVWEIAQGEPTENAVKWALEAGYRHIDTAKFYKNEMSVGKALKDSGIPRKDIWITTKLWPSDFFNPRKAIEESLIQLGLDYIDLYLIHWPLPGMSSQIWKAMEQFANEGLAKSIGVSNYSLSQLEKLLENAITPPAVNQVKCSPYNYPKALHEFCIENKIALEAYSPLTRGRMLNDNLLVQLADKYKKSSAQILLRWALQKNLIIIPKSQNKERITENSLIYDFNLEDLDVQRLDSISAN